MIENPLEKTDRLINHCLMNQLGPRIYYNRKADMLVFGYWYGGMVHMFSDFGDNWYMSDELTDYEHIGWI